MKRRRAKKQRLAGAEYRKGVDAMRKKKADREAQSNQMIDFSFDFGGRLTLISMSAIFRLSGMTAVFMDWEESRYEKTTECTDAIEVINYERPKKQQGRRH